MPKTVIFCESYGQINYTLRLVERRVSNHEITLVIPGFKDLYQFFRVINEQAFHNALTLVHIEPYQPRRAEIHGVNKIYRLIPDIFRERLHLHRAFNTYLKGLEDCEVFFFSRGFNGPTIYLLKKLSRRNHLVYISLVAYLGPPVIHYKPENNLDFANLVTWKLIYGRNAGLGSLPFVKGFFYVTDRFIKEYVDRTMDNAEIEELMRGFDLSRFRVFDTGDYDAIYFDDNIIGGGYVPDASTLKRELAAIFEILNKYFPEEKIAYKYHPGYSGDRTMITFGHELASFVPAELLYSDKVKLYLSVFSKSIANVEKGLVVSLADLITFKNNEVKNLLKEHFRQSCKLMVLFPGSLDEFERIVLDIADKALQGEA